MYLTIRKGDCLPTVALAQARIRDDGAQNLKVDGIFGFRTVAAVTEYQRKSNLPLTGKVEQRTWAALSRKKPIEVVDVIDASDILVFQEDAPYLNDGHSKVMVNYGMSRGALQTITRLVSSHPPESVAVLRFHGHGGPGEMRVAGGGPGVFKTSSFAAGQFVFPEAIAAYRRLGTIMKPYGSIELHGCRVALGGRGHMLLSRMAGSCGVPVTAGLWMQSGQRAADRFEGPVSTQFPHDRGIKGWASRVFSQCQW